jgi:hypothetical protein
MRGRGPVISGAKQACRPMLAWPKESKLHDLHRGPSCRAQATVGQVIISCSYGRVRVLGAQSRVLDRHIPCGRDSVAREAEILEENRKVRRLQIVADLVMNLLWQSDDMPVEEAAELVAQPGSSLSIFFLTKS